MPIRKLRKGAKIGKHQFDTPITQVVHGTDTERFTFNYRVRLLGYQIFISKGFIYDGASIPRFLWSIIGCPFRPKYRAVALVHDYLYSIYADRKLADQIFKQMLLDAGVSKVKAATMYRALRMFGGRAYRKCKRTIKVQLEQNANK